MFARSTLLLHFFFLRGSREEGGRGSGPPNPGKITKLSLWGFLKQCWSRSCRKSQLASHHSMFGYIDPPAKWYLNGVSLMVRWWPAFSVVWNLSSAISTTKEEEEGKTVIRVGPSLAKLSAPAHVFLRAIDRQWFVVMSFSWHLGQRTWFWFFLSLINPNDDESSWTKGLHLGLSLYLHSYFVYAHTCLNLKSSLMRQASKSHVLANISLYLGTPYFSTLPPRACH